MPRLQGKVAILSGGARGIGAAEARLFAREGAHVIIGDVLHSEASALAADVNDVLGQEVVIARRLDVTVAGEWAAAVEDATSRWGGVDILVNNAGIVTFGDAEQTTEEEWDRVIAINQKGTWLGIQAVIPSMKRRGGGSIVNISSIGGLVGTRGFAPYHATKGAVRMLAKHVAVAFGTDNIRANTIYPGPIETPMLEFLVPDETTRHTANAAVTQLKRIGTPEEIAYAVLFLASDEASFITGADLAVDGGVTAA